MPTTTKPSAAKKQRRRGMWVPLPLIYCFLLGFGSITYLNFMHLHGSVLPSLDSNLPVTWGSALSHPERMRAPQNTETMEMSACMIVMDDNHFLIEWLAYHYHTANLRHLIIASDPHSRTSPSKILDRWKDRISIQEWNETRFLPEDFEARVKRNSFDQETLFQLQNHRVRQHTFNLECLKELKRQNRGWTMLIDTDEYLVPREDPNNNQTTTKTKSAAEILQSLHIPAGFEEILTPCIPIERQQFTSKDSSDEKIQSMVAPGFDGKDFQTLRWRKYGYKIDYFTTTFGHCGAARAIPNKVMIDLRRVTMKELIENENKGNPHQPIVTCNSNIYDHQGKTPFVLHHYMGTPEQWFYRDNDKRGIGFRKAKYEDMNKRFGISESDAIRPWLTGFVAAVGSTEASRLLKDVGKLETLPGGGKAITPTESPTNKVVKNKVNGEVPEKVEKYKVGDVVEVNFAGEGEWYLAEVYDTYSNDYYSVFFEDCTQEIATREKRMRRTAKTMVSNSSESSEED